jgi:hypothetical protein
MRQPFSSSGLRVLRQRPPDVDIDRQPEREKDQQVRRMLEAIAE